MKQMLPVWRQTQSVLLLNNCIFQPAVGDVPIADFLYIKLNTVQNNNGDFNGIC